MLVTMGGGGAQLTRTRRMRHLIHAPFSRTSAVCSGRCRCLFLLPLLDPLLDEVSERPRLASWGKDGGEGGYDEGGDEAEDGGWDEDEE